MNLFNIIEHLAEVDSDVLGRFDSRRAVFNSLGSVAKRAALATSPLFLGALFQKAYAGTTSTPIDVLNYALTLELLEADFYRQFIAARQIPSGADDTAIRLIKSHEDAHVTALTAAIRALSGTPVAGTATTGIRFNASLLPASYADQLKLAQLLEDTGVRAYKGRAAELLGAPNDLLTVALQIHSVEARHAAHIRSMRNQLPWPNAADDVATDTTYTGGVPNTSTTSTVVTLGGTTYGIPAYERTKPSMAESNINQGAIGTKAALPITTAFGDTPPKYSADDAAAAFDEALQPAEVLDASRAGRLLA
ncbi:ferritin-like domain-containing protein [Hymenobacter negativus]|uniref:Ferritin-like domain-containing protein n=1 Tax=Hymenobacter negativus TaxID=2795026 RepID=A0ABS3QHS0_9BACT|nr:ferritin-like domain-containing protein [Hymenobacter negativus]MBO2010533.1 ferritin-like domain-containing protein [Hymenobacter negativus]